MKLQHLFLIGICISLVGLFATVEPSQAQIGGTSPPVVKPANGWLEYPIDYDLKRRATEFRQVARSGSLTEPATKAFINNFIRKAIVPEFTEESKRATITSLRSSLSTTLRSSKGQVHDYIVSVLADELGFLSIDPRVHPISRFNAAIMLGDLNQVEMAGSSMPKPLPAGTLILMKLLNWNSESIPAPQLTEAKKLPGVWTRKGIPVSDEIITAALLGLERHAALGIAEKTTRQRILAELCVLLDPVKTPKPTRRSADGHAWILENACRILGLMRETGPSAMPLPQLAKLMGNSNMPFEVRCEAAQAIGTIAITINDPNSLAFVLRQINTLVADTLKAELAADMIEPRRIRYRLQSALSALVGRQAAGFVKDTSGGKGIAPLLPAAHAKASNDIIKYVIAPTEKPKPDATEIEEAINTVGNQLKKLTGG